MSKWMRSATRNHSWSNPAQERQWAQVSASAYASGVLHVTVLGASVSNGCGACDYATLAANPLYGDPSRIQAARNASCRMLPPMTCAMDLSWAHMMRDQLSHALQPLRVKVSVTAKNAVGPAYFLECTQSKVPADTHIILAELATNAWGGAAEASAMLARVHLAAPRAVVAFVTWMERRLCGSHDPSPMAAAAAKASAESPADVLHVHSALSELLAPAGASCALLYAQHNRDAVHPNALGHRLLGAASAAFVLNQMEKAPMAERDGQAAVHAQRASLVGASPSTLAPTAEGREEQHAWLQYKETCYDALHLPVAPYPSGAANQSHQAKLISPGAWHLVDEGVPGKGIPKLGWVSDKLGQRLRLGPLSGPAGRDCALMRMRVGYLSKPGQDQGDLLYSCEGCICVHDHDLTTGNQPFPRIPTDANIAPDHSLRRNISVTASSSFLALWKLSQPCHLVITHAPHANARGSPTTSHVRVDSLSVHHRGVFGYAHKVLGHPRAYSQGLAFAARLLKECPQDCTPEGTWPCPGAQPHTNHTRT